MQIAKMCFRTLNVCIKDDGVAELLLEDFNADLHSAPFIVSYRHMHVIVSVQA
jgi:hypothetical protein